MNNNKYLFVFGLIAFTGLGFLLGIWWCKVRSEEKYSFDKPSATLQDEDKSPFTIELIARGLAAGLNDPSLRKNSVLENFCASYQGNQIKTAAVKGGWVGHALLENPYQIRFFYKDVDGRIIDSDSHIPSNGDLLEITFGTFITQVLLTEAESSSVYFYFFGE